MVNTVNKGANQVGGKGNQVSIPTDVALGSVIVAGQNNTVSASSKLGAVVASSGSRL